MGTLGRGGGGRGWACSCLSMSSASCENRRSFDSPLSGLAQDDTVEVDADGAELDDNVAVDIDGGLLEGLTELFAEDGVRHLEAAAVVLVLSFEMPYAE